MARRQRTQRQVTSVVPDYSQAQMFQSLAQVGEIAIKMKKKRDKAKMNNFLADSQIKMAEITQQWRVENESNPTDPKALQKLEKDYRKVLEGYKSDIGSLSMNEWNTASRKVVNQQMLDTAQWGFKREQKNMLSDIATSMQKHYNLFANEGRQYGQTEDVQYQENFIKKFKNSKNAIYETAEGIIGEETISGELEEYKSDAIFSFIMGMAENNPELASEYMERADVQNDLGDPAKVRSTRNMIKSIQSNAEHRKKMQMYDNRIDTIKAIASGDFSWDKAINTSNEIASYDPKFAEAIMKNFEQGQDFTLEYEKANSAFARVASNIFKSGTKEEVSDFVVETLSSSKISRDRLGIIAYAARFREREIEEGKGEGEGFWGNLMKFGSSFTTKPAMASFILFNSLNRASQEDADEDRAKDIIKEENKKANIDANPNIITIKENEGQLMEDEQGNRAIVYPDGSYKEVE